MTMDNHLNYLVKEYYLKKKSGLGFREIRRELEIKNYSPEDINHIIKCIDDFLIYEEIYKLKKIRSNEIKYIGYTLTFIGVTITLLTLFGIIYLKDSYIFAYGPMVGGILMVLAAKKISLKYDDQPGYRFFAWRRNLNRFNRNM